MKWFFLFISLFFIHAAIAAENPQAILLHVQGAIGPASEEYIQNGFEKSIAANVKIIILQIDTPGGLDTAMRGIIRQIIASPVPVAAYVAPGGARAASAGTYILYASQIAAMAPGTNLGAATPVMAIAGPDSKSEAKPAAMEQKAKNDASAYIRSLAQLRGRNVAWAEQAVKEGASLSAEEALKTRVIDLIADDVPDLLQKINGRTVMVQNKPVVLQTTGLTVEKIQPDWHAKFLSIITDPNIAYILLMIGIWGLFFEFAHPGTILPGVSGIICLLLALYAFQLLPVSYAGLGLILLGIGCMIAEAFVPAFGTLGIGGLIAFVIGSFMLLGPHTPGFEIALPVILAVSLLSAGFFLLVVNMAVKARFRPVVTGREELIGKSAVIVIDAEGVKKIQIHGEWWQVQSTQNLQPGQKVKVTDIQGVKLNVEPE